MSPYEIRTIFLYLISIRDSLSENKKNYNNCKYEVVLAPPLTDYDLTTTRCIELHHFEVFCKKCSFKQEKYNTLKSR